MPESTPRPPTDRLDEQLALLANGERRAIIAYLREEGTDNSSLDTLATALAPDSLRERDHVRIRLHHCHLPKLAQTSLLSYDTATTIVRYHGHSHLETVLDALSAPETVQLRKEP